jgi:hypothetical protein
MIPNPGSEIEKMIIDYLEQRQKHLYHHNKRTDAEKEYNKLLAICGGAEKKFSLDEANKIYKAYQEILINGEQSKQAEASFNETYTKLKELGRILSHASITADIITIPLNGEAPIAKQVTVSFPNGEVLVA